MIELLLDHGALINATNSYGLTPFHEAATPHGEPAVLELLLERGADIERGSTIRVGRLCI